MLLDGKADVLWLCAKCACEKCCAGWPAWWAASLLQQVVGKARSKGRHPIRGVWVTPSYGCAWVFLSQLRMRGMILHFMSGTVMDGNGLWKKRLGWEGATRTAYLICCCSLLMSEGFSERRKLAYNLYSAGKKKKIMLFVGWVSWIYWI